MNFEEIERVAADAERTAVLVEGIRVASALGQQASAFYHALIADGVDEHTAEFLTSGYVSDIIEAVRRNGQERDDDE